MRGNTQTYEPNVGINSDCSPTPSHGLRNTGTFSLTYDASGRLKTDPVRGITSIGYDNDGLVTSVHIGSSIVRDSYRDGEGNLLRATITDNSLKKVIRSTTYTGDGHVTVNDTLQMARFPGGYFSHDGKPYYYITDYQGNNAKVVDANGGVRQTNEYYPYGEPWLETNWYLAAITTMCRNRYMYGDKERLPENGMNEYDFAGRQYVASQMRFTTPDPLAEERPGLSPYIYCNSNPIMHIDPSGKQTITPFETTARPLTLPGSSIQPYDWSNGFAQSKPDWSNSIGQNKPGLSKGIGTAKVDLAGASVGKNSRSLQINASENGKALSSDRVDGTNAAASVFGMANGIKDQIIEYAVGSDPVGTLGKYTKVSKGLGGIAGAVNATCAVYNVYNYFVNGGTDLWVVAKYTGDTVAGVAAFVAGVTAIGAGPAGLVILGITAGYYILDVTNDGFWLDYSPAKQTNK